VEFVGLALVSAIAFGWILYAGRGGRKLPSPALWLVVGMLAIRAALQFPAADVQSAVLLLIPPAGFAAFTLAEGKFPTLAGGGLWLYALARAAFVFQYLAVGATGIALANVFGAPGLALWGWAAFRPALPAAPPKGVVPLATSKGS
jgi:hypothetical protein